MKTLLACAAFSIAVVCTYALQPPAGDAQAPKGKLVVVGGGGTTPEIMERAMTLAGGKSARLLIVAQASSNPQSGEESKVFWMEKGATNVAVLDLADETVALRAVEQAAFIWMPGGDQSRLFEELAKTKIPAAIRKRYEEGAVVGGTSAGAAVMSQSMLIGGDKADLKSVRAGGSETAPGLGLWPEVIVDQHFVKRQRFTRLLACVLDHPELVGVGIDEKTAVIVSGSQCEVVGESSVLVIDARSAKKAAAKAGELASATDMKLHVFKSGDKFDLAPKAK